MITRIGRRLLELGLGLFALLGFAFVPLGKKTGLEHTKAIFATEPAREAGRELAEAGQKLRDKMLEAAIPRAEPSDAGPDSAPARTEPLMCTAPLLANLSEDPGDAGARLPEN